MKKIFNTVLFIVALFATSQLQAQNNLVVTNTTSCGYVIDVYVAPAGGCVGSNSPMSVNIPPGFAGIAFTSAPGDWVVGTGFPSYSFGVSNPIGSACNFYPPTNTFMNMCSVLTNVRYTQAPTIFTPSRLSIF